MISNIEKICEMLDERGIEYEKSRDRFRTRFRLSYCEACADYLNEIDVLGGCITASKNYLTPEQAIAVILGSDAKPCYATDYTHKHCKYGVNRGWTEDTKFYVPTLRHGTLTAEQVREAIEKRFDFDVWVPKERWQAIADELNEMLGNGTCRMDETESYSNANDVIHVLECSACGKTCEHVNGSYPRCPHCGRMVKQ